jgi:hypothetical protein
MNQHCCEMLRINVENECDIHPRRECPDALIEYFPGGERYGLMVHDGQNGESNSTITISFCPWCGTKLPNGLEEAV